MKKQLALLLALLLLGGCAAGGESSSGESVSVLTGETVSGIITKVNGNEITLDLVTLNQGSAPRQEEAGEAGDRPQAAEETSRPARGEGSEGGREGRGDRSGGESPGEFPGGGEFPGEMPSGGMPSAGGQVGSGQKSYTRTGETALYQIPVGAEVLTLTGTSRGFNSLTTDLLVTITFREDGVTPGQVQVIQSLS